MSIVKTTGYMDGLFTEAEMYSENVTTKESKIVFLEKVIEYVKLASGKPLSLTSARIVAGQEPEKTNELLQVLAIAITSQPKIQNDFILQVLNPHETVRKPRQLRNSRQVTQISQSDVDQTIVGSSIPIQAIAPIESIRPIAPIESIQAIARIESIQAIAPIESIQPIEPIESIMAAACNILSASISHVSQLCDESSQSKRHGDIQNHNTRALSTNQRTATPMPKLSVTNLLTNIDIGETLVEESLDDEQTEDKDEFDKDKEKRQRKEREKTKTSSIISWPTVPSHLPLLSNQLPESQNASQILKSIQRSHRVESAKNPQDSEISNNSKHSSEGTIRRANKSRPKGGGRMPMKSDVVGVGGPYTERIGDLHNECRPRSSMDKQAAPPHKLHSTGTKRYPQVTQPQTVVPDDADNEYFLVTRPRIILDKIPYAEEEDSCDEFCSAQNINSSHLPMSFNYKLSRQMENFPSGGIRGDPGQLVRKILEASRRGCKGMKHDGRRYDQHLTVINMDFARISFLFTKKII